MGKIGNGYGSECHLLMFLGRHRQLFNKEILKVIGQDNDIEWLDFEFNNSAMWPDSEHNGLAFLDNVKYDHVLNQWKNFWPQKGNAPNWDAVGWFI